MNAAFAERRAWPWWLFAAVQVLFWAGLGVAAVRRTSELDDARRLPPPRTEPLRIRPLHNFDWVVTDEQLHGVLHQLQPRFRGEKPRINYVDHALRFWRVEAEFPDPRALSGREMRDLLTSHSKFRESWGPKTPPLLTGTPRGVKVRMREGTSTSSHVDHTLATLAECGTPIDFPVQTDAAQATVKSLLAQSLRDFSPNQIEYEWSTLVYALYLPQKRWISSEGQTIDYDLLVERLMRQRFPQGVCFGNHRIYTLVIVLRIDETQQLLSPDMRARAIAHLQDATRRLIASQSPEGFWDGGWAGEALAGSSEGAPSALGQKILATGHALEWWAMAPAELHPPRETLVRAAQWLCRTIADMDEKTIEKNYTFLSHAGRSLALWRGVDEPAKLLTSADVAPPPTEPKTSEPKASEPESTRTEPTETEIKSSEDSPPSSDSPDASGDSLDDAGR